MKNEERKKMFIDAMSVVYDCVFDMVMSASYQDDISCDCESHNPDKKKNAEPVESDDDENDGDVISVDDIQNMNFSELKEACKALNLSDKGVKDVLKKRLIEFLNGGDESEEDEPDEKDTDSKDADDEEAEDIDTDDEAVKVVEESTKDMSTEEIRSLLSELGRRSKGKREALLAELVEAFKDGDISFEDDEEEQPDDYDTPERKKAMKAARKEWEESYKEGSITEKDLREWYANYEDVSAKEAKKVPLDDIFEKYVDAVMMYIDDGGNEHEDEEVYSLGGKAYCCGVPCEYDKKKEVYVCQQCGGTYDEY